MAIRINALASVALLATGLLATSAFAQTSVISYGRITAVRQVDLQNQGAQTTGALVGGLLGVASGSGQSSSNRALRGRRGWLIGGFRVHDPDQRHEYHPHGDQRGRIADR